MLGDLLNNYCYFFPSKEWAFCENKKHSFYDIIVEWLQKRKNFYA